MNQPEVQEADVHPFRLQYLRAISSPSYNLSSILSIIPGSQFLNRLRKGNGWFEPSMTVNLSEILRTTSMADAWPTAEVSSLAANTAREKVHEYQQMTSFPSPWEFFTSGYIVGLLIMAILLHRMQNVVIPSPRRARHAYRRTFWDRLHAAILPLNFSHTTTRLVFHLPSIYFLTKMLMIWMLLVLQTCEVQFVFGDQGVFQGYLKKLARASMEKEMSQICWSTFCAVCGAFFVEGLIKALDGLGNGGFPLGGVNNLSPFHLVSYAFLLHIYSSPVAHGFYPADDSPSRPDKHVIITITIALLQLSMFHILSISKGLSTHRLIPTALTSLLSLAHFHATIFFHLTKTSNSTVVTLAAAELPVTKTHRRSNAYMAAGATYPLLNYVPNLFETALLATILLTVTVNAVAQLLVRGRIDHVLSGLGFFNRLPNDDGTQNGFFANLPYEEDFVIVLLRIGVASLEATGLRGWNNEVAPIQRPKIKPRKIWGPRSGLEPGHVMEDTYGRVRIGRLGVAQVQCGTTSLARTSSMTSHQDGYKGRSRKKRAAWWSYAPRLRRGFNNDVRTIDLGHARPSRPWSRSMVASWQFLVVLWGVLRGLVFFLLDRARGRVGDAGRKRKNRQAISEDENMEEDAESIDEDNIAERDGEVYQRFLRGEDISDDDEDAVVGGLTPSDGETSDDTNEGGHVQERETELIDLFTDLLRNSNVQNSLEHLNSGSSSGEMALAHLVHGSTGVSRPLTRRRWNTLMRRDHSASPIGVDFQDDSLSFGDQQTVEVMSERYYRSVEQRDREKSLQHICVICMLESRQIICWPCRCLAMCDGCRETLASRTPTSKHRCPCCRQIVDGYSRIYIP